MSARWVGEVASSPSSCVSSALEAGARIAVADLLLVQWTSYAVAPAALANAGLLDVLVLLAIAALSGGVAAAVTSGLGVLRRERAQVAAVVLAGALPGVVYGFARARALRLGIGEPRVAIACVALGACAVALAALLRSARGAGPRSRGADLGQNLLVGALSFIPVLASVGAARGPRVGPLPLAFVGLLVTWIAVGGLASRGAARGRGAWRRLAALLALGAATSVASYPLAPGFASPSRRAEPTGARAVLPEDASAAVVSTPGLADSPDVILVVLDTVSARELSLFGHPAPTSPALERFAEHADTYEAAYSNASWTLPAHASLLTGLLPSGHGAQSAVARVAKGEGGAERVELVQRPLDASVTTLAERLAEAGWHTGAVVANHGWFSEHYGLAQGFAEIDRRAQNVLALEPFGVAMVRRAGGRRWLRAYELAASSSFPVRAILERADEWLTRTPRPRFLLVNLMDAHGPYTAAYRALADPETPAELIQAFSDDALTPQARYRLAIHHLDRVLGAWLDSLAPRGIREHAIVVITADHGETFDRPGQNGHGLNLFQTALHVPLVIAWPGQTAGRRVATPVALVDVMPTVLERLGLPAPGPLDGVAFGKRRAPILAENSFSGLRGAYRTEVVVPRAALDRRLPSQWAVLDPPWKLIVESDGERRLFDLASDPGERNDVLARHPEQASRLERWLADQRAARTTGARDGAQVVAGSRLSPSEPEASASGVAVPDEATRERLKNLGYTE